jgi:hypothetical protein
MADHDPVDDRIRRAWADLTPEDATHPPLPTSAWDRVARETSTGPTATGAVATGLVPPPAVATDPPTAGPAATDAPSGAPASSSRSAGRRSVLLLVAAVLALVVVGVGVVARSALRTDDPALAAEAALSSEGLEGAAPASGRAELLRVDDHRVLDVSVPGVRPADGTVLEVWLIDPESDGLRSLGTIDGGETRLPVPDAIDVDRFSIVDVSVEPLDGDPAHSADSVVRGPLAPT